MKIAALVARYLLGLMFLLFSLNGLHPFLPMPPLPEGLAGQFMGALMQSHYAEAVAVIELVAAVLLVVNRFVPLGLTLLAPILVNIILFHVFMAPATIAPGLVAVVLWVIVALRYWKYFAPFLIARAD